MPERPVLQETAAVDREAVEGRLRGISGSAASTEEPDRDFAGVGPRKSDQVSSTNYGLCLQR